MKIGTIQEYIKVVTNCLGVGTQCRFEWNDDKLKYSIEEWDDDNDTKSSISLQSVETSQLASFKSSFRTSTPRFMLTSTSLRPSFTMLISIQEKQKIINEKELASG